MRRDHSKALQALAGRLWDQVFQERFSSLEEGETTKASQGLQTFEIHPEPMSLVDVLHGVIRIQQRHLDSEGVELHKTLIDSNVLADRIILRQILISLCYCTLQLQYDNQLYIQSTREKDRALLELRVTVDEHWDSWISDEDTLDSAKYWAQRMNATLEEFFPIIGEPGTVRLMLSLPIADQTTVLVIDDQQPTLRMYQRYLSRSNFKVVGIDDPTQAISMIHKVNPDLILLDVMMPQVDGWEILQGLKLDENLRDIPIIVCSAWESMDLAKSLGAVDFLKKPITQERLLAAIQSLYL
jgi:CheY-like chemotaxis protein